MASHRRRVKGERLRIVAGELGGRRLHSPPPDAGVRPSAERTREAIFSMLGPLQGARVLDLYCGSGALGLEAISRGAAVLTLVDERINTAAGNVELLDVGDRCRLREGDALALLAACEARFDLVLCDPPYRLADRLGRTLDRLLTDRLRPGGRVVVESSPDHPLSLSLTLLRERRYGSALVRIYGEPRREAGGREARDD
jgi:16S rRNA (guanine966-N2)-methyltransferase